MRHTRSCNAHIDMAPSRRKAEATIESLKRTLCSYPGRKPMLREQELPEPTLSTETVKVALAHQSLGQDARLAFHPVNAQMRGTVLCLTPQNGKGQPLKTRLVQASFCCKVPPPPPTSGAEAIALAHSMFKRKQTLAVYSPSGCYWMAFNDASQMAEWETVSHIQQPQYPLVIVHQSFMREQPTHPCKML